MGASIRRVTAKAAIEVGSAIAVVANGGVGATIGACCEGDGGKDQLFSVVDFDKLIQV